MQDGKARPWRIIAQKLSVERNQKHIHELSHELVRALNEQVTVAKVPTRSLTFCPMQNGQMVIAFCNACDKRFEARPEANKHIDYQVAAINGEFEAHKCE
jgi:hypothetical protein